MKTQLEALSEEQDNQSRQMLSALSGVSVPSHGPDVVNVLTKLHFSGMLPSQQALI